MSRQPAVALLLVCLPAAALSAQETEEAPLAAELSVEEILARHVAARGGAEALAALDDLEIKGIVAAQGLELPMTVRRKRPNLFRVDMEMQGMTIIQAYDGTAAWGTNPMMGQVEPTHLSDAETRQQAVQADLDGFLVDAAAKGHQVELAGREDLDGTEVFRLEVSLADGSQRTVFLDAEDFLERKQIVEVQMQGMAMEAEVRFEDYRDVAGVLLPHRQVTVTGMGEFAMTFASVVPGADIDPEVFLMPGQEANPELTLEQILERHRAARIKPGSESAQTVKAVGKVVFQGFEVPMTMYFMRPNSFRVNIDLQGLEMVQAFDGEVAWTLSPMQGITEPEALPDDARDAVAIFSDFLWGLMARFEAEGATMEMLGIAKVERDETYHVKVALGDSERDVYLGGKDFLERQLSFIASFMGSAGELDALLSEYETVEGLVVPHHIQLNVGGTPRGEMKIETVEVNAEIDADAFSMPPKPAPAAGAEAEPGARP